MKQTALNEQILDSKQRLGALHKRGERIAAARLLCFVLFIAAAALGYDESSAVWLGIAALAALVFCRLVIKHRANREAAAFQRSRRAVLADLAARFDERWRALAATGAAYRSDEYPQGEDLDVFGRNSLYQYLCCAYTPQGKDRLADALRRPCGMAEQIAERQAAVKELIQKEGFSLEIQTIGHMSSAGENAVSREEIDELLQQMEAMATRPSPQASLLLRALPLPTLIAALLAYSGNAPLWAPALLLPLPLTAAGLCFYRHQKLFGPLRRCQRLLQMYARLFAALEKTPVESACLQTLQQRLLADGGASAALRRLQTIGECIEMRCNFIFFLLGNTLFAWDFHCAAAFAAWEKRCGGKVRAWLEAVGETETLISLGNIGRCKKRTAFPKILSAGPPAFTAEQLSHPLLKESAAVPNDAAFPAQTGIITGSNMSGKTTFLRAVGISCVLAYAGAPVCAARLELAPMRLFTSMRIADDVSRGISTFYAELLRIKTMISYAENKLPMLALIDEIFKGTNSADRIIGAEAAIRKLTNAWCITLVSTHDSELCRLAEQAPDQIVNYHIAEHYQNDAIYFDYKIKSGPSQTTNAKYLLRMVGIS